MVRNAEILLDFELKLEQELNNSYEDRLKIFESMLEFRNLVLKNENPLEGLTEKVELIRMLHCAKSTI